MLVSLELGHRHEIVGEQSVRFDQRACCGIERHVAEPMTEAQEMLLENRFFGNVGVFLEIRFQRFGIGFGRRREVTHLDDPSDRNERGLLSRGTFTCQPMEVIAGGNCRVGPAQLFKFKREDSIKGVA